MGARAPLPTFGVVGSISIHCPTIRQAIDIFVRYRRLVSDAEPPSLVEEGDRAILTFHFIRASERCSRLRAELGITALVRFAFMSALSKPRSVAIEFEHEAPSYAAEYEKVLGFPVGFGRPSTRILFERRVLDEPQIHANPEVRQLLESQAERRLGDLSAPPPLSQRVRDLVADHYQGTKPPMEEVARKLSLSGRSLRRRLSEEGTSYASLLEEAFAEVARRKLSDPSARIQEVAHRMGFSEASAFHRAFKRAIGVTPAQFREGLRPAAPRSEIVLRTLADYEANAARFWEGTKDHDVSQNCTALLERIEGAAPFAILDLGCGPGRDLAYFRALGHEAIGVEGCRAFCEMARSHSGCEVLEQDFLALSLPAGRFDGVFANASLFHVPGADLPRVLGQLHAALKPRGVLFASNPHGDNREGWNGERYGAFWDLAQWREHLVAAGFEEIDHYYRPPGKPRSQQPWLATVWRKAGR
jgi:AraC-like DNA-binding protein/2-polyprenyl-3-methyl-5-hydroxy-6-metoxy-1,4-benzoquinol methylase